MELCCKKIIYYRKLQLSGELDFALEYVPKFREFGISVNKDSSKIRISHCPWCGSKLPSGLRERWFHELENMFPDFDGFADERIPPEFQTDEWWKKRAL